MTVASGQGATLTEPFLDLEPVAVAEQVTLTPAPVAVALPALVATPMPVPALAPSPIPTPTAPIPIPTAPRRPFLREQEGQVVLAPTGLFAVDVAAELSAALSMRMAPPPVPTPDRTYAIGGWAVGTLVGLGAWVLAVWVAAAWLPYVALVGGAMIAFGFLWRAYLSGRDGAWVSGLVSLLPPVGLVQLFRPVSGYGRKPLLFVVSGGILCGLFAVGGPTRKWFDERLEVQVVPGVAEPADENPAAKADSVAERLGDKAGRDEVKQTLVRLGPAAEPAVRRALAGKGDAAALAACDVLEQIGTAESVAALRKLADEPTTSRAVRIEAASTADAIQKRLAGGK